VIQSAATGCALRRGRLSFAQGRLWEQVFRQRLRVRFDKKGLLRFISHRDLMRLFERALRRAALPLAMTQGYNPHPRISFPMALGTGIAGEDEVMEFELQEWLPATAVRESLALQLPPGITLREVRAVRPGGGSTVTGISYRVRFLQEPSLTKERVRALLQQRSIPVRRRRKGADKDVDIRPFLKDLRLDGDVLTMDCCVDQGSTTRPEEVLQSLGVDVAGWLPRMEMTRVETVLVDRTEEPRGPGRSTGRGRPQTKR